MKFAKPCFDFGLTTDSIDKVAAFWRDEIGLPFNHELPLGPGHVQHRDDLHGSARKLRHSLQSGPNNAASLLNWYLK